MARDFDSGVFGDVIRDEKKKQEDAKREAQRSGRGNGSGGGATGKGRPTTKEPDAFDQLSGGAPDPDLQRGKSPGRVKLGG